MTFVQPYEPQTKEELEAATHVAMRLIEDGQHNVNGCPYPMRAVCPHKRTIEAMKEKGWVDPPTLAELKEQAQ